MIELKSLSEKCIIDCLISYYGINVSTLDLLPLGSDQNASVYKAKSPNQFYFVKVKKGHHHEAGIGIMALLQDAGIQQIIPLIKTIHGQSTQQIDNFTLIVYPFIEGQDGFSRPLLDEQWVTLGKTLRQVHDMYIPFVIQESLRRETYSPQWRNKVRTLYIHLDTISANDEISLKLLKFMLENAATIHQLVNQAEALCEKIQIQSSKFVLCHSDIHAGNVLMDINNNIYIVDWDEPIMAPKERDLMFIGAGVANVWNKPYEEELFYQGYGKTQVNRSILAYYRYERIVEDIAIYCEDLLFKTNNINDRLQMYQHFMSMFEPQGVVEIAQGSQLYLD